MQKLAIIVALQAEFDLVKNIFENYENIFENNLSFIRGKIGDNDVVLMKSGIGKVNAAVQLSELIGIFKPDYVINTGVAGGIDKVLRVGDAVVSEKCAYHDVWCGEGAWGQVQGLPLYFNGSTVLLQKIKEIAAADIHFGLICTGDQFISENAVLQNIKHNFPDVLAVDMESAAMAHVCFLRSVPFVSVRIISDTPFLEKENINQYFDFFQNAPKRTFEILQKIIEIL
jgi:adenosylhomocysteine nucleosidase